ncbi:MAG TPA: hypothetical protein VJN70_06715 [Gemmatimonadaceae bacterium]|nr:hypothetical protein [Gemmatimonadaceae bacterium]
MRIGDFAVEVVPRGKGIGVREIGSGHVLARAGQVYALRLRNFGPLRCVADVSIDGRSVTAGGLVIDAYCTEELERPITPDEDGRFTVVAEGDERVFGPDGGRDNPDLGLIEVRFRREIPGGPERVRPLPPTIGRLLDDSTRPVPTHPSRFEPGIVTTTFGLGSRNVPRPPNGGERRMFLGHDQSVREPATTVPDEPTLDDVERAAGTGLTGHSSQRFAPTHLGPLEREATVIQLRLVIATVEAIDSARETVESMPPVRPAARP